jgi:hypothetical protein
MKKKVQVKFQPAVLVERMYPHGYSVDAPDFVLSDLTNDASNGSTAPVSRAACLCSSCLGLCVDAEARHRRRLADGKVTSDEFDLLVSKHIISVSLLCTYVQGLVQKRDADGLRTAGEPENDTADFANMAAYGHEDASFVAVPLARSQSLIDTTNPRPPPVFTYALERATDAHKKAVGVASVAPTHGSSSPTGPKIRVVVRKRPLNSREVDSGFTDVINTAGRGNLQVAAPRCARQAPSAAT